MTPALALAIALAAAAAPTHRPGPARPPPPAAVAPTQPAEPVTIFRMQQIGVGQPLTPELARQLEPVHTLDEVEALLKAARIPFVWRDTEISSTQLAPQILLQLAKLPPHEPFIAPQGEGVIISVIVEQHPAVAARPAPNP